MKTLQTDKLFALGILVKEILLENDLVLESRRESETYQTFLCEARMEVARRRGRRSIFEISDIFADPAWDILLELFIADATNSKLSVTAVGLESGVAMATVIRWISILENHGLVRRTADLSDKRRIWVSMSNKGRNIMRRYFNN